METKEYRTVDKSEWPRGAWDAEPDKIQWPDADTGLPCLIVRGPSGSLCGYVGVTDAHPLHGKDYSDCAYPEKHESHEGGEDSYHYNCSPQGVLEAHGGITFADSCVENSAENFAHFQKRYAEREAEASKFPTGDAARFRRDWAPFVNDYAAWIAQRERATICHLPAPGEPANVWWFGFDCAHSGDVSPGFAKMSSSFNNPSDEYRDIGYVKAQCGSLAKQLVALAAA